MPVVNNAAVTRVVGINAALAFAYAAIGFLGLQVPYYGQYVTLFWAPTAIALTAVVLLGPVAVAGIYFGSFALNLVLEPGQPLGGALIAAGNTLGPTIAGVALVRVYDFRPQLDRVRDVFAFFAVGVIGTGMITATLGAFWFCMFGVVAWRDCAAFWLTWFGGEAAGSLIVAPLLLTWLTPRDPVIDGRAGAGERVAMVVSVAIFAAFVLVYGERLPSLPYGFGFFFMWSLFRAGRRGVTLAVVGAALPLAVGTALGTGPFLEPSPRAGMLSLWMTIAVAGSACCTAGALLAERDRAMHHQRGLIAELDHRVKNTLATVVALVGRDHAIDVADFRTRFVDRVRAIARTHEGLARSNWEPMQVEDVVAMTLMPFADAGRDHLHAIGSATALAPSQVTPLTMVLHELATNAAKHGAWSREGGRVDVAWANGADDSLCIDWHESGGPKVISPPAPGYGLQLIEGIVDHQLGGRAVLAFREEGLLCTLHIPSA